MKRSVMIVLNIQMFLCVKLKTLARDIKCHRSGQHYGIYKKVDDSLKLEHTATFANAIEHVQQFEVTGL